MPEPIDEESAKLAIEYGITIFRALIRQTENTTVAIIANSAMLQASDPKAEVHQAGGLLRPLSP